MMNTIKAPKYKIGQQYTTRNKCKDLCTVTDIHTTYNLEGDIVKQRYVATHVCMGQLVTDYDVPQTTIDMALENQEAHATRT